MSQTDNYANVPVYTGQPPATQSAGFFQPPAPEAEGILATDQARAVAEVQAALVIAASRPRNELRARDRLLQACQRVNLASGALYQYSRGGTAISGPSIRLAEAAARAWGNMTYGFRELSRRTGESECEAYAWDLETNTKAVRQFPSGTAATPKKAATTSPTNATFTNSWQIRPNAASAPPFWKSSPATSWKTRWPNAKKP